MRTTIDLPEDLYRSLKARAAFSGIPLKELIRRLIEQGLTQSPPSSGRGRRDDPPIIIPTGGSPIPALTGEQRRKLEEEEDVARYAGPA